jgi:site-specific DNA-methyltransferase (adenine-specific)
LPSEYIVAFTKKGDGVIEPFGGAGTTLIACEELGRKCYCMELDPKYCDVIIDRWSALTGLEAQLL